MKSTRREFIRTVAATSAAVALGTPTARAATPAKRLGVSIATYSIRWGSKAQSAKYPGWSNALEVLEHSHELGAGCLQVGVNGWESDFAGKMRARREQLGIVLEGQISLPKTEADVPKFDASVRAAKEAGAMILRAVCQSGRRYDLYESAADWEKFKQQSWQSLTLAEAVVKRHGVKLAIENHKDWRVDEQLAWLRRLSSEWVGVNLDLGNNLALLEEPMAVVEALAPFTFTTHFKDMGVEPYGDGFRIAEVPLGDGFLDLKRMKDVCEKANPAVQFNLEMITRDPLPVPVFQRKYWASMGDLPARDLAAMLALVREKQRDTALPRTTGKTPEEQLAFEEANNVKCFKYAREHLGLA